MLLLKIANFNTNYIVFTCPECGYEDIEQYQLMCSVCNIFLPNISETLKNISERINFHNSKVTTDYLY